MIARTVRRLVAFPFSSSLGLLPYGIVGYLTQAKPDPLGFRYPTEPSGYCTALLELHALRTAVLPR